MLMMLLILMIRKRASCYENVAVVINVVNVVNVDTRERAADIEIIAA